MILHFIAGFLTCAILYTFVPGVAQWQGEKLRAAWDWLKFKAR